MERRELLMAGAALGAAGLALAGTSAPAAAATSTTGPTIFDYGAVGDGVTDDSAAFSRAIAAAAAQGLIVTVPARAYAIKNTISWSSTGDTQGIPWGLNCQGAYLISKIFNGSDVIRLTCNNNVRYMRITGGLKILGSGSDGSGLHLYCPSGTAYFYNATIEGVAIEYCGQHGLFFEGNVFETAVSNCWFQNNKQNGATFAHSGAGICSAITCINCYFNSNLQYGMAATVIGQQYGGTTDVRVIGGYCRENNSYGFYYNNGISGGASLFQVGFENNCKNLAPGDPNGAHVYALVSMNMLYCTGYDEYAGATNLLKGYFVNTSYLDNCGQGSGGTMASTGKSRLISLGGTSGASVIMRNCGGGIDNSSGSPVQWVSQFCSGPSPKGNLNPLGTVTSF
jgi:hypothetical protein